METTWTSNQAINRGETVFKEIIYKYQLQGLMRYTVHEIMKMSAYINTESIKGECV